MHTTPSHAHRPILCGANFITHARTALAAALLVSAQLHGQLSEDFSFVEIETLSKPQHDKGVEALRRVADHLDDVSAHLARYGTISVSAPKLIAPEAGDGNPFAFDPKKTASDHFAAALLNVQATQRLYDQSQLVVNAGATYQGNLTAAGVLAHALEKSQAQTVSYERGKALRRASAEKKRDAAIASIPATATAAEREAAVAKAEQTYNEDLAALESQSPGDAAQDVAKLPDLPAAGSLLRPAATNALLDVTALGLRHGDAAPALTNRAALITAAGDTATQGIFAVLADSAGKGRIEGKRTLLGAMMVNAEPGWATRENFIAEATVTVSYNYQTASDQVIEKVYTTTLDHKLLEWIWRARPELVRHIENERADRLFENAPADAAAKSIKEHREFVESLYHGFTSSDNPDDKQPVGTSSDESDKKPWEQNLGTSQERFRWMTLSAELKKKSKDKNPRPPNDTGDGVIPNGETESNEPGQLKELGPQSAFRILSSRGLGATSPRSQDGRGAIMQTVVAQKIPEYLKLESRQKDSARPLAIAVSPMTDSQTLDFDHTIRRRQEFSLALAAALSDVGMKAQAEMFSSFARQQHSDLALRSQQATVTAFSGPSGNFGFRVAPQLDADLAPKGKALKSSGKKLLKRTSFPAMILIEIDQADLQLAFRQNKDNTLEVLEPVIEIGQAVQWIPMSRARRDNALLFWRPKQQDTSRYFRVVERVTTDRRLLERMLGSDNVSEALKAQAEYLRGRLERMGVPILAGHTTQRIPTGFFAPPDQKTPPTPKIAELRVNAVGVDQLTSKTAFSIGVDGEDLSSLSSIETVPAQIVEATWSATQPQKGVIEIKPHGQNGWPKKGQVVFRLKTKDGSYNLLTPPFTFVPTASPEAPLKMTKTTTSPQGQIVEEYKAEPAQADVLKSLLLRDTPPAPALMKCFGGCKSCAAP